MTTAREESVRLADLLGREHHALAEFLVALSVFDRERRWIELGYSSLFDYLHRELTLSRAASFYRLTAARLLQKHPQLLEPLRDGRLCFTTVVELAKVLTAENLDEVLPRFFHVSKREAQQVRAELAPEPAPERTVVTAIRGAAIERGPSAGGAAVDARQVAVHPGEPVAVANPLVAPRVALDVVAAPRSRSVVEPKNAELARVHVTVPRRLLEKLVAAKDAISHSHPNATDAEAIELGLDLVIERHRKRRGIGAKPRNRAGKEDQTTSPTTPPARATRPAPARRSRHVPADVWRAVWERDGGQCVWPIEGGGVCGSTRKLQLDHVDGFALGGETSVERCRLLCAEHQDVHARALYGDDLMNHYTRPKRGDRCSEPVAVYASAPAGPTTRRFLRAAGCRADPRPDGAPPLAGRRSGSPADRAAPAGRSACNQFRPVPRWISSIL